MKFSFKAQYFLFLNAAFLFWPSIYLSFERRYTKFGLKIFEIDFVTEI